MYVADDAYKAFPSDMAMLLECVVRPVLTFPAPKTLKMLFRNGYDEVSTHSHFQVLTYSSLINPYVILLLWACRVNLSCKVCFVSTFHQGPWACKLSTVAFYFFVHVMQIEKIQGFVWLWPLSWFFWNPNGYQCLQLKQGMYVDKVCGLQQLDKCVCIYVYMYKISQQKNSAKSIKRLFSLNAH